MNNEAKTNPAAAAKDATVAKEAPAKDAKETTEATAEEGAKKKGGRAIIFQVPENLGEAHPLPTAAEELKKVLATATLVDMPRKDFIVALWKTKQYTRRDITDICQVVGDNAEMPYQIVFQATNGVEGGAPKKAKEPKEEKTDAKAADSKDAKAADAKPAA